MELKYGDVSSVLMFVRTSDNKRPFRPFSGIKEAEMKVKMPIRLAMLMGCFLFCVTAQATSTLVVNGSGILTGARGVDVLGTLYDVDFIDGTCFAAYGDCLDDSRLPFHSSAGASAAAEALLSSVF